MKREKNDSDVTLTRRAALKLAAAGTAAGILGLSSSDTLGYSTKAAASQTVSGPGHVVKVHMPGMRAGAFPDPRASRIMVDRAVATLARETDASRAWSRFISPTDRVGIKVNCLGTRMASSMVEVVYAVADAVRDAGVPDSNIMILDMYASNMMGGRYTQATNPNKLRVLAHRDHRYQKSWIHAGPARVKLSNLFLWTTAIINVPPIKDHDLAGVTCTMKNMTFGVCEKPHVNHGTINESIAHLYALDEIRSRVKLNIIDGSAVLYDGGPKYNRAAHASHECIYATEDPVAMDAVAFELIELLRAENGLRTLADVRRPPTYLELAQDMGLGISDRQMIHLQTVDLPRLTGPSA